MKASNLLPILIWVFGASLVANAQSDNKPGCSSLKRTLYVDNKACTNDSVQFDAGSFKDAEYSWDFNGDGVFEVVKTDNPTPKYNYVSAGNYNPYVVIYTDECTEGVRNFANSGIEVKNVVKPVIKVNSQDCENVKLEMVSNGILTPDSIVWKLYDTFVYGEKINHQFNVENGIYEIAVQTFYNGCVAEATEQITIEKINATPVFTSTSKCAPAVVNFSNKETYKHATYNWYVNGELKSDLNSFDIPVENKQKFDVELAVKNQFGCYDSIHVANAIEIKEQVKANAYFETNQICSGDEIKLVEGHKGATRREVIWGDGDVDTTNGTVKHKYNESGVYNVTVIAFSEQDACADSLTIENAVTVYDNPTADFNFDLEGACVPQILEIKNASMGKYDNATILFNNYDTLNFNDFELIKEPGLHEIRLQVENSEAGCKSEMVKTFKLNNRYNENLRLEILDAKLEGDDFELSWNGTKNVSHYEIYKMEEDGMLVSSTTDTQFTVKDYAFDSTFANYAIKAVDQCGASSALSSAAAAIKLDGHYKTDSFPTVQWKPFTAWDQELDHYMIERKDAENDNWEIVAETNLPHYIDRTFNNNTTLTAEYRVTAVHSNAIQQSISTNYKFNFEPNIFIPTAFSPNYDNLNDEYVVKGHGMERVDIQIFNEWGQRVFGSEGENIAWDGKHKGQLVEPGTYICVIEMETPEGYTYNFQNTITVFR
ncbi:MAG: gliding motility-associated C-terminal domain-containing protein [Bacteroidia bacterium]